MSGGMDFIPPRFFVACTQFHLHFYEDGTVCLRGLVCVKFKDKLLREMKSRVPMFKHHAMKTCMGVEMRHSFRAGFHRFRKIQQQLQTLGTRMVTRCKFQTEDPQTLGAVVQKLVPRAIPVPGICAPLASNIIKLGSRWL